MDGVQARLQARFPDLDPTVVEAAVRLGEADVTASVGEIDPLLVERAAGERLHTARAGGPAWRDDEAASRHPSPSTG